MMGAVFVDRESKPARNTTQAPLSRPGNDFIVERLGTAKHRAELLEREATLTVAKLAADGLQSDVTG